MKNYKRSFEVLFALLIFSNCAFAQESADLQKVKVKDSYLTSVVLQKDKTTIQEVEIQKSFLVRVLVKSSSCDNTAKQ